MSILYPIDRGSIPAHQFYCGPAALCAITGMPGDVIVERVNELRGKKPDALVKWMFTREVVEVLRQFGYRPQTLFFSDGKTRLNRLLPNLPDNRPHVILVTGHFLAVLGRNVEDNRQLTPTSIEACPRLGRKRVQEMIDVSPGMN